MLFPWITIYHSLKLYCRSTILVRHGLLSRDFKFGAFPSLEHHILYGALSASQGTIIDIIYVAITSRTNHYRDYLGRYIIRE